MSSPYSDATASAFYLSNRRLIEEWDRLRIDARQDLDKALAKTGLQRGRERNDQEPKFTLNLNRGDFRFAKIRREDWSVDGLELSWQFGWTASQLCSVEPGEKDKWPYVGITAKSLDGKPPLPVQQDRLSEVFHEDLGLPHVEKHYVAFRRLSADDFSQRGRDEESLVTATALASYFWDQYFEMTDRVVESVQSYVVRGG